MSGNGYTAPYDSAVDNNKNTYPLQYPYTRPSPVPVQPRSSANANTLNTTHSAISSTTYRNDDATTVGVGGVTDSPKRWPSSLPPDSNTNLYTDPYNAGKTEVSQDFKPSTQLQQQEPRPHPHPQLHGGRYDDPNRWSFDSVYARPPGLRRFTGAWFKWHWRLQVSRRRLPRLFYILLGILLMIGWLSVAMVFTNNVRANEAKNSADLTTNGTVPPIPGDSKDTFIFMSGQLNRFDPSSRTLNIDWTMFGAKGPLDFTNLRATEASIDDWGRQTFALFRDTIARPDKGLNLTEDGTQPFRVINPNIKPVGFLGMTEFDTINTDIGLGQKGSNPWLKPEFGYPFDVFQGTITWVVASNDTITATRRPGSGVFGMRGAILTDSLLNFKVRSNVTATCYVQTAPGCELVVQVRVERTALVRFCVFAVFLVNWIVTIAIFLVTGEALLLNRTNILSGTDILAICFSALFALPSVRSLLPGVPGYGCLLDMVGILPNVIIVALCATFFANSRLCMRTRMYEEDQEAKERME